MQFEALGQHWCYHPADLAVSLPLGPRVLPLRGACVMVHVIHPSIVLSLLCHGKRKKSIRLKDLGLHSPLAPTS